MNIDEAFPSKYLRATDLEGRTKTFVIDTVAIEDVGGENKPADFKPVVSFAGDAKPLVLNKTNSMTIKAVLGPETTTWRGKKIEVFPSTTPFQGKMVPCLRVRMPEFDDDVPAFAGAPEAA